MPANKYKTVLKSQILNINESLLDFRCVAKIANFLVFSAGRVSD